MRKMIRAASLLAPADRRAEWVEEWESELWYVPRRRAMRFCLGAFQDAIWVRRNAVNPVPLLASPFRCAAALAALAAVGLLTAVCLLLVLPPKTMHWRLSIGDLPASCLLTLVFSCMLFPAVLPVWQAPARLRGGLFLAVKIVLMQPILVSFLIVSMAIPVWPVAAAGWILALRWIFTDQQRRCPACLRLLTHPVRIGTASRTFLEWHGIESICSRGHGLLHTTEGSASYSRKARWLRLDSSWSGL